MSTKHNSFTRVLCTILSIAMMISVIPLTVAHAEDDPTGTVRFGTYNSKAVLWDIVKSTDDGILLIAKNAVTFLYQRHAGRTQMLQHGKNHVFLRIHEIFDRKFRGSGAWIPCAESGCHEGPVISTGEPVSVGRGVPGSVGKKWYSFF